MKITNSETMKNIYPQNTLVIKNRKIRLKRGKLSKILNPNSFRFVWFLLQSHQRAAEHGEIGCNLSPCFPKTTDHMKHLVN